MELNLYLVFMLVLMAVSLATSSSLSVICNHVCNIPQAMVNEPTQLLRYRCRCIGLNTPSEDSTTTMAMPPAAQTPGLKRNEVPDSDTLPIPTLDTICKWLCMFQIGGDACFCSLPLVPGK